ncbi:MAG: nucleoside-diphosphate kinase [Tissierellales bacterium]|nr:nucleoside-diphosphate kinase [Tissierellales bacterium]
MERTLVLIKPDAVHMKVVGNIISKYEEKKLDIAHIKILIPDRNLLENHYEEHREKDFFPKLINFMSGGRVVAMVLEGENVISKVRKINGHTDPNKAEEKTIRNLYGTSLTYNAVHGSDSVESANKEISLWFDNI